MKRSRRPLAGFVLAAALFLAALGCARGTAAQVSAPRGSTRTPPTFPHNEVQPSTVPDSSGWGTHVLALSCAPGGAVWVGTYGQGIYVSRDGTGREWENLRSGEDGAISWNFVNAFAFAEDEVWYGTIGNGWGLSRDGGRTWKNWTFDELGPRWLYVTPEGMEAAGDTVWIATADGLRITSDDGSTWRDVTEREGLVSRYITSFSRSQRPESSGLWAGTPRGVSLSDDGGRAWRVIEAADAAEPASTPPGLDSGDCSESQQPLVQAIEAWHEKFRSYPSPGGEVARPGDRAHFWFERPIRNGDNWHLDQTYTYGSTMGGNFQQHQGVEFNNPEGTPVRAIGDGVVRYAGEAEQGALTVAILHDRRLEAAHVWSTYYHNSELLVKPGQRVAAAQEIARVGSTGRATNDHLHLEIHVTPTTDSSQVVHPEMRYPPYTVNPQLWIHPLPGTGAIAGRVLDAAGRPVPGARVYGVTKPLPGETPFSFAETYEDRAHPDPVFGESFAIGDVPAGSYVIGTDIEGTRVFRNVEVEAGRVTEVTLQP